MSRWKSRPKKLKTVLTVRALLLTAYGGSATIRQRHSPCFGCWTHDSHVVRIFRPSSSTTPSMVIQKMSQTPRQNPRHVASRPSLPRGRPGDHEHPSSKQPLQSSLSSTRKPRLSIASVICRRIPSTIFELWAAAPQIFRSAWDRGRSLIVFN